MASDAQIEANKANAKSSTGPRTEAGKEKSSRNATRHGLTAKTTLLPGEDPAEYEVLSTRLLADYDPLNTAETALVIELIDTTWRLQRASLAEARILSADVSNTRDLNYVSLHAARIKRQFSTTLKEFQQMHAANARTRAAQLEEAVIVHTADRIRQCPSTLAQFGFDFTPEEIERHMWRQESLETAKEVIADDELDCGYEDEDNEDDDLDALDDAA